MTAEATNGSCCSSEGTCHSGAADVQVGDVTTTYKVSGMTCGHCEGAVSSEISEIPGVHSVQASASTGLVTVVSKAPLDESAVRAAVDEAGYELEGLAA
ncbi:MULTISPECIES: heavy-metal-associated domain-containing protein [Streptomyces]|uniref:heavy-metal-associated domain-containing protein n=1 Tax=Streptomyces TaxID=1883 RepID=UPI0004C1B4EE|nr:MULTISPECIES: heavy-metal-associated domain-containing protein [Streptomyces]KOT55982.1 copper-binding protein [Streptomyces rimosus subsp. rimosus]KOT77766.1 copper-binding protein [Streptomyces rimosus subsp. pseudoverticillatus]KWT63095.1 copper-binding protein [Streptomyces albus subsp. albus]RSO06080.1 copper chaperone [Streptomyces sp. WAC 06783]